MKYQTNFLPHQKFNFLENNKKVIQNITKKRHFVLICILYLNKKTLRKSFIAYLDRRWANFCCLELIWKTFENVPVGFLHSRQIEQHLVQSPFFSEVTQFLYCGASCFGTSLNMDSLKIRPSNFYICLTVFLILLYLFLCFYFVVCLWKRGSIWKWIQLLLMGDDDAVFFSEVGTLFPFLFPDNILTHYSIERRSDPGVII